MIIKPKKEFYQVLIFMFCASTVGCLVLLRHNWRIAAITYGLILLIIIRFWMATGRTFIMSESGCIVQFFWYRKEYQWDDFQLKAIENFEHALTPKSTYKKGVIFSKKPIHKPWWWEPSDYSMYIHPLSFIYINFTPEKRWEGAIGHNEMDEETVLAKMKEWHVELEEIDFYHKK